ncbi:MAG: anthrax toxin-like adenylyl cyclase domain-containing protein [Longimicrobiales bacterium]
MRLNDLAFLENVMGMPMSHKQAFLAVARSERVVIMVRATGPTCHGLLAEGYDTKGYRIHGKSCDWGPMAGFVMRDPRLNKYGARKAGFNRAKHTEALELDHENQGWKASTTPLKISRERVAWLQRQGLITVEAKGADRLDGHARHPSGIAFYYSLIREDDGLYGVYFDNTRLGQTWRQEKGSAVVRYHRKYKGSYEPMLAMTNPPEHRLSRAEHHLNAVTGDYDLFAVWPFVRDYDASAYGPDHRPLGTVLGSVGREQRQRVDALERDFTTSGQGTKLGNITPRIYMVCQLINSLVGRHVLWHSDESARPFLDDVDLPVGAFTPAGNFVGLDTILDFKAFIRYAEGAGIRVVLSNAWAQDPDAQNPNRLGSGYGRFVPADGQRIIVPDWYNA